MRPARRPAIALSRFDLPDAHDLLIRSCEDCACAVTASQLKPTGQPERPAPLADVRWVRASDVAEIRLDDEHVLAFNPLGSAGVVVLNDPAHQIFGEFTEPATLAAVEHRRGDPGGDTVRLLGRLAELELVHPLGEPARPEFHDSQVLTAWLHVTNGCNLRCPYCYLAKTAEPMTESVGRAAVAAVIESATANGFPAVKLKYAGGEASLNHRLTTSR